MPAKSSAYEKFYAEAWKPQAGAEAGCGKAKDAPASDFKLVCGDKKNMMV